MTNVFDCSIKLRCKQLLIEQPFGLELKLKLMLKWRPWFKVLVTVSISISVLVLVSSMRHVAMPH